jgi:dolichol-phosphate mannosyltransferase
LAVNHPDRGRIDDIDLLEIGGCAPSLSSRGCGMNTSDKGPEAIGEKSSRPALSVIVPCYNEQDVLAETHRRLSKALDGIGLSYEIIYADDGSQDRTASLIREFACVSSCVRGIFLSRNFGHQIAVTAGLDRAAGQAAVIIDADLQDPPELIADMVSKWRQGYEVVYGLRTDRPGETGFKIWTARAFYRVLSRISEVDIPLDVGDFRLIDRRIIDVLTDMRERDRYLRGMVAWAGFKQCALPYRREPRSAGKSKYPLRKMLWFALDGLLSFSMAPLRAALLLGLLVVALSIIGIIYAIFLRLFTSIWVSGWTLLFIGLLVIGGIQLTVLGAIGEYVGRIYMAVKARPLYIVRDTVGFERTAFVS